MMDHLYIECCQYWLYHAIIRLQIQRKRVVRSLCVFRAWATRTLLESFPCACAWSSGYM
jgi:hypothetical protein